MLFSFYYSFSFRFKTERIILAKVLAMVFAKTFAKFGNSAKVQWWGVLGTYISTSQERDRGKREG
jgi:hypothetical protein